MSEKEEREDKGFVVRDRRKISLDDAQKEQEPSGVRNTQEDSSGTQQKESSTKQEEKAKEKFEKVSRETRKDHTPFPEVTFSTFIFSLSSSALVHLGEVADPYTQKVEQDLSLAKQVIDTLGMLEEKTRGNLDADEDRLMKTVLYDLRMRFVQKSNK